MKTQLSNPATAASTSTAPPPFVTASLANATRSVTSSAVTPPPASASSTKRTWRQVLPDRRPVLS